MFQSKFIADDVTAILGSSNIMAKNSSRSITFSITVSNLPLFPVQVIKKEYFLYQGKRGSPRKRCPLLMLFELNLTFLNCLRSHCMLPIFLCLVFKCIHIFFRTFLLRSQYRYDYSCIVLLGLYTAWQLQVTDG